MADRKVITPTEARQGTPQKMNYRVLSRSLMIAAVAAIVLYVVFYMMTPA